MSKTVKQTAPFADGPAFRLAETAAHAALVKKGEDVLVLDLAGRSDVADYFVIVTGGSDQQVDAVARGVVEAAAAEGQKLLHGEGRDRNYWVLLDFVDVIVHVLQPRARQYYALERLWNDAPRLEVGVDYFARAEIRERRPDLQLVRLAGRDGEPTRTGGEA
ncbi:MAG: ribosome silencing factor [bacterium]|nr:ribosome silencing factor [bacterium]